MAINPGIPIPSAMPRVPLERPFNGAEDGEDEDAVCTVEIVSVPESTTVLLVDVYSSVEPVIEFVGTDAEIAVERIEPTIKVGVGVAEDDPD